MKKFTKVSLIIVAIIGGIGVLLCGISSLMGAGYGTIRRMAQDGELDYGNWHVSEYGVYYDDADWDMDDITVDVDDIDVGDIDTGDVEHVSGAGTTEGDVYTFDASGVKKLVLDVNAAVIDFTEGTDAKNIVVKVYQYHEKYYESGVNGDTLFIKYDTKQHYKTNNHTKIVVELPVGMQFDGMDLDIGAADADFAIDSITCENLTLNVGAGELTATGFTVTEKMDVSLGVGSAKIDGGTYKNVKLDCGVGSLSMAGTVAGDLTASCGMGEVDLELNGKETDYNYKVSCGMGDVEVNGKSYSNISGEYSATNEGSIGTIDLDCGMGSIEVQIVK